jgi:hypothetical protein
MISSGEELFHRGVIAGFKTRKTARKRPPREAIRDGFLFRKRTRMTPQSTNCGDQVVAVEDLEQPVQ